MPALLGRARERDRIDEVIATAADRFAALVLVGEEGVGKTALLEHAIGRARARGFRVFRARPGVDETGLCYLMLADLLAEVGDEPAALPAPLRAALDGAAESTPDAAAVLSLVVALRSLLRRAALEQPLLVTVDDLERTDPASARVLGLCLRRLGDAAVGFLGTVGSRATPPGALGAVWDEHPE